MKYDKLFSYCLKNDKPDNLHQFHYVDSEGEPTVFDWDNWIAGKLYSNIQLSFFNREFRQIDLSSTKDKKAQLRDFLDYHYSKYGDICFLYEIKELINLFETSLGSYYKIDSDYMEMVNGMIRDWCKEKEQIPEVSINITATNNQDLLNLEDLLINISDEKKAKFLKRLSAIIQKRNKPKEFAIVLVALSQMGHIELTTGGRNRIYRVFYKESGYDRSFNAFASGINHNIEEKGNTYTVLNSNQTDIDSIIKALA